MAVPVVGILSPGHMGHAVGRVLVEHGVKVLTCLEGRSERTGELARKAGIEAVPTYGQLARDTDIILSILVPAEAKKAAITVAKALHDTGEQVVYVDCNAIAPTTVREIGEIIVKTGSPFIDAGIIGEPPTPEGSTLFCASGTDAEKFENLNKYGLKIRLIGKEIGQASGLKMTYAALTKGTTALSTELLVAAWQMGLYNQLVRLFQESQPERYAAMERAISSMPFRARRWVGEMEEIAKTFEDLGLTPKTYQGAADIYRLVSNSPLADETPETRDTNRTLVETIESLAKLLEDPDQSR